MQFCVLLWLKQQCAKSGTNPFPGFPTIWVRSQILVTGLLCQGAGSHTGQISWAAFLVDNGSLNCHVPSLVQTHEFRWWCERRWDGRVELSHFHLEKCKMTPTVPDQSEKERAEDCLRPGVAADKNGVASFLMRECQSSLPDVHPV